MTNVFVNTPPPSLKLRRDEPVPLPPSARRARGNNKKTGKRRMIKNRQKGMIIKIEK